MDTILYYLIDLILIRYAVRLFQCVNKHQVPFEEQDLRQHILYSGHVLRRLLYR